MTSALSTRTSDADAVSVAPDAAAAPSAASVVRGWRTAVLLGTIIVTFVVFQDLTGGTFFTSRNLSNLSVEATTTALVALGVAALIVARELDLSVGSLVAVVVVLTVYGQEAHNWSSGVAVFVALAVGVASGVINGFVTTAMRVPSFIVTLAGFSYLRGVAYAVTNGQTYAGVQSAYFQIGNGYLAKPVVIVLLVAVAVYLGVRWIGAQRAGRAIARRRPPDAAIGRGRTMRGQEAWLRVVTIAGITLSLAVSGWVFLDYRGLPIPVAILMAVAVVLGFAANHTAIGRHCYAIGGNPEAARRAGIRVERVVVTLFIVSGVLAAVAGVVQASLLDAGPPAVGLLLPLDAISAAVVGGTSLFGGQGTVAGVLLGTLLLASIQNGLALLSVNSFVQYVVSGLVLLVAVCADSLAQRYLHRA
jgi:D-xylose transport system permease protein